jgi:predicted AlkP superfamily phosphohydrolase/phosphomutase
MIGMDGASIDTFKRGWTPYIESLIQKGYQLELKEDLLSRGWVEIFTGKHAIDTGASYDNPILNRSLDWTLKFNLEKIPGWGTEIKPIWQVLNERGYKVGIMNVPTTFPAPEVNGFFVSGGGGGAKAVQEATEELCYPKDIVNYLKSVGYIVDERMESLIFEKNLLTVEEVFSRFRKKNLKRTEAFIKLSKEKKVDFGFVVYKSSSVMVEFFTIPELERKLNGKKIVDHNILKMSKNYYLEFDKQIKTLVESFKDAEVIFVSDHSEVKSNFEVNINYYLQNNGFQVVMLPQKKIINQSVRYLRDLIKPIIPFNLRKAIPGKRMIRQVSDSPLVFDPKTSVAFCLPMGDWSRGIYINDEERFNGVVSPDNIIDLSHEISNSINNDKIAKEHGITSHVKPRFDTPVSKYYPDIALNIPDGYIVRNNAKGFVTEFEGLEAKNTTVDTVEAWAKDCKPYCVRGHHPIAVSSHQWSEEILPMRSDLTVIYRHLLKQFI